MNFRITFIFLIVLSCFAKSFAQSKSTTLLTLDSKPVTVDEFVYLYTKNHQGNEQVYSKEKINEYFDLFINFKLKVEEARHRGMDTTQAFHKELNSYKEELKKPYTAEKDDLERLTKEAYDRMKQEVKASHILIAVKPDALPEDTLKAYEKISELRSRIIGGEDFEKLAREFSEDPSAKSNGGSLGYFTALQMVFPFEDAAFKMNTGDVSKPVRTRFGYHILRVEDKRPSRGEVEVSHILIRGNDEKAKTTINKVHAKAVAGEEWDKLCKEYSQDPGTKDKGGRLRPFGPGALASAPTFEERAFSMTESGEISEPFETPFGWHIIRLERKIPLPPYEEIKESLKKRIARDERMQISKAIADKKRKEKLQFKEVTATKNTIFSKADTTLTKGNWKVELAGMENEILFSIQSNKVSVGDFVRYIRYNQTSTNVTPAVYISQLYDRFVESELNEAEDKLLQLQFPEYRNLVNEYGEGILLFGIMEKEVWNKASDDSIGQHKYYDNNLEKYQAGDRIRARVFTSTDNAIIDSVQLKIQQGDTLTVADLKKFKSVADFRSYEKGENRGIDAINWTIGMHKAEADGMYYLVEVDKLVPPGPKDFAEVRANVISDYQDYLEKEWIARLKEKYPVKMNKKGVKEIMKLSKK